MTPAPLTRRALREAALAEESVRRESELIAEFERLLAAQRASRVSEGVGVPFATLPVPQAPVTEALPALPQAPPRQEPAYGVTLASVAAAVTTAAASPQGVDDDDTAGVADTAAALAAIDGRADDAVDDDARRDADVAASTTTSDDAAPGPTYDWPEPQPSRTVSGTGRQWVPRLAVLTALGAATIVIPLTATSRPQAPATVAPQATSSALDTLAPVSTEPTADIPEIPSEDSTAAADQLAQARAELTASRSSGRGEVVCSVPGAEGNGALAAIDAAAVVDVVMPLQDGTYRVTSQFGYRWGSTHEGVDFAAPSGTPIHAVAGGTVIYAGGGKEGRSGQLVIIEHELDGEKFWSWYVHMYPSGVYVSEGDQVLAGDVIGAVGSYGNSTGPHLHLEIHVGEELNAVDPPTWLAEHDAMTMTTSGSLCS